MEEQRVVKPVTIGGGTRLDWVDILRAFAVFCVVLGHTLRNATVVYPWLYCFHVPLCVMTSGIVFHHGNRCFTDFIKNKFFTLMVPYYCFAFVSIVLYAFMGDMMEKSVAGEYNVSLGQSIYGMIYANSGTGYMRWNMPLWFLPMLFSLVVIAWFLYWDKQKMLVDWLVLVASILMANFCYTYFKLGNLPLGIETAIYLMPFFGVGKLFSRYLQSILKVRISVRGVIGSAFIVIATIMSTGEGQISYNADSYGARGYMYFVVMSVAFCLGFTLLATLLKAKVNWLSYVGKNTIGIMTMHKFPILFFVGLLPITKNLTNKYPLIGSIMIASVSVVLCLIASEVIYHIFPVALGKKRIKEKANG